MMSAVSINVLNNARGFRMAKEVSIAAPAISI
jgi:hypothetical protein